MFIPDINVPEKEKNEEWHKSFITALIHRGLRSNYALDSQAIDSAYDFYNGSQGGDEWRFLQEAEDGSQLPARWMNLNKIRTKINLLLGELMEKGYDFRVSSINKDAKVRKHQAKEELRVDVRQNPIFSELEEETGLPSTQNKPMPESEDELDEWFEKNAKEKSEVILYHALRFIDKRIPWATERVKLFADVLIAGKAFVKTEIVNGVPVCRRVDPRYMVYDSYSENDFLKDSTYFGEVRYMNIADAAEKYNLTREELKQAAEDYKNYQQRHTSAITPNFDSIGFNSLQNDSGLKWFKQEPSGLRVLVMEACWVDYKNIKYKNSEGKHGDEHFKKISDASRDKEGVVSKRIKTWRGATLVGGQFLKNWGELPNQPRDRDSLSESYPPYCAFIPYFINGRSVSIVDQLKGLQNLKNIIHYNIQLVMARAGAKGFVYDVSQCPEGWEPETVIKYLKTVGIAFIDSKANGTPSNFNQFQQIDMSLSTSVDQYLNLSRMVDAEMDAISGISEARQGITQGASQAVGVTRSALLQSSLTTAPYFKMFDQFTTNIFNQLARLVKVSWAGKEKFAPIIGDAGIDFLNEEIDVDLDDYAVFVEATPRLVDDLSSFQQLVMAAIQSGDLKFGDAMTLLMEKDVPSAIQKYNKITAKREREMAEMQQQQEMAMQEAKAQQQQDMIAKQAEFNNQQAQQAAQRSQQTAQIQGASKKEIEQMKAQAAIQQELVKQRGMLKGKKADALLESLTNKE